MPSLSLPVEFGRLVREWRAERGYSQEKFAHHCGIHRTYMTHIERGTRTVTIAIAAKIARGFEIELSGLFLELEKRGVKVDTITDEPEPL